MGGARIIIYLKCSLLLRSNLELLQLSSQPLLRRRNSLVNFLGLRARALPSRLLTASLAANDFGNSGRPFFGSDALGCEILFVVAGQQKCLPGERDR